MSFRRRYWDKANPSRKGKQPLRPRITASDAGLFYFEVLLNNFLWLQLSGEGNTKLYEFVEVFGHFTDDFFGFVKVDIAIRSNEKAVRVKRPCAGDSFAGLNAKDALGD